MLGGASERGRTARNEITRDLAKPFNIRRVRYRSQRSKATVSIDKPVLLPREWYLLG